MDQEQLVEGANLMLKVAKEILAIQTARQVNKLLLQDGETSSPDEDETWMSEVCDSAVLLGTSIF